MAIDRYRLSYYAEGQVASEAAIVRCYQGSPEQVTGIIRFYPSGSAIPPSGNNTSGVPELQFPLSRFNDVMTTLRTEAPYITISQVAAYGDITGPPGWALLTGPESIGDLEVKP
jgi:hypothetical protein